MMVIPAILTDTREVFADMLTSCSEFTDYVQVDIMDGDLVPSKSISQDDLLATKTSLQSEAHLMVRDPLAWVRSFKSFGSERIIFHYEAVENSDEVIAKLRQEQLGVGLAVNPPTEIEEFRTLVDKVDMILFMSVHPGFYGATFVPSVLDKIKEFRKLYPTKHISIDGGVKMDNFKEIAACGVNDICIGSALLRAENLCDAYRAFTELLPGNE